MDDVEPRRKSWWGRNWTWVVPLGCLMPVVVVGGCFAGLFFFVTSWIKSSDVYMDSLASVTRDPQVQAALGEPITPSMVVTGGRNVSDNGGNADVTYYVSGPKGSATVHVVANSNKGVWKITTNHVRIKSTNEEFDVPVTVPKP